MTTENKLNIFDVLKQADKHNFDFYDNLTTDQQKEFSPWLVQRWISSKKLELVNEITNPLIGSIPKGMAWRLFCAIGVPSVTKYSFIAPPKKLSSSKSDKILTIIADHYKISNRVAATYLPLLGNDDIIEMAELQGIEDKEINDIKKLLK